MTVQVLNTRPELRAGGLTQALRAAGYEVSELPLLDLQRLSVPEALRDAWQQVQGTEVVVVVSSLAAREGLAQLSADPRRQWLAVGATTAQVLREAGLTVQVPTRETSEGLLALPALARAQTVWLWQGVGGRQLLAETVLSRGQRLHEVLLYARQPHPQHQQRWPVLKRQQGWPDVVLLTSGLGAQLWRQLEPERWHEPALWVIGTRIWAQLEAAAAQQGRCLHGGPVSDLLPSTVLAALSGSSGTVMQQGTPP